MNKSTKKNWMRYFASTLAISGMMLLGACGSDQEAADEVSAPEIEMVNREVEEEEYTDTELATTETMQEDQNVNATTNWNRGSMAASSVDIDELLNEHPEVNQAIRTTLSDIADVQSEYTMQENMID